jgi:8-oxo-dGTP pyrophosphatase MutT (NUDIX family)
MGSRRKWQNRALSWCTGLLKELRVPVSKALSKVAKANSKTSAHQRSARRITAKANTVSRSRHAQVLPAHVAAICYRNSSEGIEFLLVRTRAGRWTFPKGRVESDPSRAAAAAREAFEEAGVFGRVEERAIGSYRHSKLDRFHFGDVHFDEHTVDAHLCEVVSLTEPEEAYRNPTWFDADKTKRRLTEGRKPKYAAELSNLVDTALEQITHRRA